MSWRLGDGHGVMEMTMEARRWVRRLGDDHGDGVMEIRRYGI
jgi:hypothetical protein